MAEEQAAFDKTCAEYEARRGELVAKVQQRQAMVRRVIECARLRDPKLNSRC
jgi:uncharacterized protein (DUF2461 family)